MFAEEAGLGLEGRVADARSSRVTVWPGNSLHFTITTRRISERALQHRSSHTLQPTRGDGIDSGAGTAFAVQSFLHALHAMDPYKLSPKLGQGQVLNTLGSFLSIAGVESSAICRSMSNPVITNAAHPILAELHSNVPKGSILIVS